MRKIEPIILSFEKEAQALNNLSLNLSFYEKMDFVRRSHMAKEMMMHFTQEIEIKEAFLKSMLKKDFVSPKLNLLLRFLKGRLHNSRIIMEKSRGIVELSNISYQYVVDSGLND